LYSGASSWRSSAIVTSDDTTIAGAGKQRCGNSNAPCIPSWAASRSTDHPCGATDAKDPELAAIGRDADQQLMDLAEDVRLCGVILIADHGQPVHQRMVGMKHSAPASVTEPASGSARV